MNRMMHFCMGWLSMLGISNLLDGVGMEFWCDHLLSLLGGICSTLLIAWLRWHWERPRRDRDRQ